MTINIVADRRSLYLVSIKHRKVEVTQWGKIGEGRCCFIDHQRIPSTWPKVIVYVAGVANKNARARGAGHEHKHVRIKRACWLVMTTRTTPPPPPPLPSERVRRKENNGQATPEEAKSFRGAYGSLLTAQSGHVTAWTISRNGTRQCG